MRRQRARSSPVVLAYQRPPLFRGGAMAAELNGMVIQIVRALLLAVAFLPVVSIRVFADDGRPSPSGRPSGPPQTEGRPYQVPLAPAADPVLDAGPGSELPLFGVTVRQPPPATLVILVGGYGTQQADDPTFTDLARRIEEKGGYHVERLGADPNNPYD